MKLGRWIALAGVIALPLLPGRAAISAPQSTDRFGVPESCLASKDLVVRALERVRADSTPSDIQDANQLLKRANDLCAESGEAWYYRSVIEAHLGHKPQADYALRQAKLFPSDALSEGINPFLLATPDSRGISVVQDSPPKQPGKAPSGPPQKWALVIGIGQFQDRSIHALNYTTKDARAFAAALKDPKSGQFTDDHIIELEDAQATGRNIREALNRIARQAGPNDIVVIYMATHGSPRSMDTVAGVNYLVTYDTEMFHAGQLDEDAMYATAYPMVDLANAVATRMRSLRTLVVLDTCYSGGAFAAGPAAASVAPRPAGVTTQMLAQMSQGTGRIVMAASQADEESYESASLGHGYFTYFLLQALKSDGAKRPLSQLFSAVAENVSRTATAAGARQHPVLYKSSQTADFTLAGSTTVSLNHPPR